MLRQGVESLTQTHTLQRYNKYISTRARIVAPLRYYLVQDNRDYPILFIGVFVIPGIELVVHQRHKRSLTVRWSFKQSMCQSINDFSALSVPFRDSIYVFQCYFLYSTIAKYKMDGNYTHHMTPKTTPILTIFISPLIDEKLTHEVEIRMKIKYLA